MILTEVRATTIPDAWFQCISKVLNVGFRYVVERGSFEGDTRLEFDWITILISHAYSEPYDSMLPDIPANLGIPNPVENGYIEQYLPYLLTEVIQSGEQYTYGSLIGNQKEFWIDILKKTPRSNQAILQVGAPGHEHLAHSPCLRHIDMRIKNGELIFYPYFRSWDLWGGFPANLAAIAVLQKYMADEIGVDLGPMCASSKGLHIYGYVEELAKLRCHK